MNPWRRSIADYTDRRVLLILPLGFASGIPLLLTFSTLSAWFATAGVSRAAIGAFALVGTPYAFKFLWSPLIDRLPPPIPLGRRRGWGIAIQLALVAATLALGSCNPKVDLARMGALAVLVAFLSASQDVVIDAYRVEILTPEQQGPGAAMIQTGYRIAMLVSGAGALIVAARYGWFAAYATMAALLGVGMLVFILGPEPTSPPEAEPHTATGGWDALRDWLATAVTGPFADFMRRPRCDACAGTVRAAPVGRQFVLRAAGGGRPSARLSRAMRRRRESDGRNGGHCAGGLSLRPMLTRVHGDSVRTAVFTGSGGAHDCRVFGGRAGRQARLGAVLHPHDSRDDPGACAADLDRAARRRALAWEQESYVCVICRAIERQRESVT
jgi:hypothetical protein